MNINIYFYYYIFFIKMQSSNGEIEQLKSEKEWYQAYIRKIIYNNDIKQCKFNRIIIDQEKLFEDMMKIID